MTRPVVAALLLLGVSCLPKTAVSRRHEIETQRYAVSASVETSTTGVDLGPFTWRVDAVLGRTFARQYRDGSQGWLVLAESARAEVEREGVRVEVPTRLGELLVELRTFEDGEILALTGASALTGPNGHLEVLDVLWPTLSPRLPAGPGPWEPFGASWPTWVAGGPRLQSRLEATWTPGDALSWTGPVSGSGGTVTVKGHGEGTLHVGSDGVLEHTTTWDRTVTTRWPGATIVQEQRLRVEVRPLGVGPSPAVDRPPPSESRGSDLEPLRMSDGRVVRDTPVDGASTLPFLLLPDDLSPEVHTRLQEVVRGAGSMGPVERAP